MSLTAGIVGLPNVGKSTLFNAITKKHILAANYPFATIDPNIGVVTVPDTRLNVLQKIYNPPSVVSTTFEFIDIAGLVKGASHGEGLGNKFLSHIREVDAVVEVVRAFDSKDIIHVEDSVDPIRDIEIINVELILADLEIIESRISKLEKKASATKDKQDILELNVLSKGLQSLQKNIPLRLVDYNKDEKEMLKSYNFITLKPIIYVANVSDDEVTNEENYYVKQIKEYAGKEEASVVVMCAQMESELADLTDEEYHNFLADVGINFSGLDKLIFATYDLLGLQTFFTAGPKEVRAWTFKRGMNARDCAGIIHTDFAKGFIKAEVISFNDFETYKDEKIVKEKGKLRLEGKDYLMQDGDICVFRFNV